MFAPRLASLVLATSIVSMPAFAQEDLFADDEEALDEIDDTETLDELEDILGDEPTGPVSDDTADDYRMAQEEAADLPADEEQMLWEEYLLDYPSSAFKDRIERRIEELQRLQYQGGGGTGPGGSGGGVGNADAERIDIAQALLLENIEPRTRIQAGFEWGLPDYLNFIVDYEHAINTNLSVHGGFHRRYTGPSIEGGVKFAPLRSVRTGTILTLIGDIHINALPAFIGFRPQVAFGKRFGPVDLQAQVGTSVAPRRAIITSTESKMILEPRLIGGFNATFQANDQVAIFLEGGVHMKGSAGYGYRFNTVGFGLKFYPNIDKGRMEVNLGSSAPVAPNYWMYHYGSIMGQLNYYVDQ